MSGEDRLSSPTPIKLGDLSSCVTDDLIAGGSRLQTKSRSTTSQPPSNETSLGCSDRRASHLLCDDLNSIQALERCRMEILQRESDLRAHKTAQLDPRIGVPWNQDVMSTLTDYYQVTMVYAYFKSHKHLTHSVFEVTFRKCPFKGEYAVMAGVNDVLRYVNTFRFTPDHIHFIKEALGGDIEDEFLEYLSSLDCSQVSIYAIQEGSFIFPNEPVVRIEGPLGICQLLETTVLNLLNFPTLVTTNAVRHRAAVGPNKTLLEFGLRRAQGPDGGMTASRYCYVGGFDATSNVRASFLFGMPCRGTHAHAFVTAFEKISDLASRSLNPSTTCPEPKPVAETFVDEVLRYRDLISSAVSRGDFEGTSTPDDGELAAFIAYAQAFPRSFVALVDTYSVLDSGVPNFLAVALALRKFGYEAVGLRIDSGDLAYLSKATRLKIQRVEEVVGVDLSKICIVASNNISEDVIIALNAQGHEIDTFGIGTNLVTCASQPALGMVFKLVELGGNPRMKMSQEVSKMTFPCRKNLYRLFDREGTPVLDIIQLARLASPKAGQKVYCQHLYDDTKRCYVLPSRVENLLKLMWRNGRATKYALPVVENVSHLDESDADSSISASHDIGTNGGSQTLNHFVYLQWCRDRCKRELDQFRGDHIRPVNPTPYKVSATKQYFEEFKEMWNRAAPVVTYE